MEEKPHPVIIRRIKKVKKHGHHGGSWKIAYADFVTAMMAFFLIMWLLSLLNVSQLEGIETYFKTPLKKGLEKKGETVNRDKRFARFKERERELEREGEFAREKMKGKDSTAKNPDETSTIMSKEKVNEKNQSKLLEQAKLLEQKQIEQIEKLQTIKQDIESKMAVNPTMQQFKNMLNFTVSANGLKIELRDLENKPMFTKGKTDFEKYAKTIIAWLGNELSQYPNQVLIIGHTDAIPFKSDQYTNWELSADRANSTRRILIKHGMNPNKIMRIMGVADKAPKDKNNSFNPVNRRIEIIILSDDAAKGI